MTTDCAKASLVTTGLAVFIGPVSSWRSLSRAAHTLDTGLARLQQQYR